MDENILAKCAIVIILKNGEKYLLEKQNDKDYHIDYIVDIMEKNEYLKNLIGDITYKKALAPVYFHNEITEKIVQNGNIIFLSLNPTYKGSTNLFSAFLPENLTTEENLAIKDLESYIEELEFSIIGKYSPENSRSITLDTFDLKEAINDKRY